MIDLFGVYDAEDWDRSRADDDEPAWCPTGVPRGVIAMRSARDQDPA